MRIDQGLGQSGNGSLPKVFIGLILAIVIGGGAALPITVELINTSGATGVLATILDIIPLFVALILLLVFAGPVMRRVR
jgi:hypothetical protein